MKKIRRVYLDNNSSTKLDKRVLKVMIPYFQEYYGVASSQFSHTPGIKAKDALDKARYIITKDINSKFEELIFTSSATESNNIALIGTALANDIKKRNKIIVSPIEHYSVLHTVKYLEKYGYKIEFVEVDNEGFVNIEMLNDIIDDKTLIVSIGLANHEVGTIQDIKTISEIVHSRGAYLHTDAAVAYKQIPIDVEKMGIDLMSLTAHKIHGPKGVGALYVSRKVKIKKILQGGYQEFDLRPGTENIPGIIGFAKAVEIFKQEDIERVRFLRDKLYKLIENNIPDIQLNGAKDFAKRIPNNLNISFKYIEGESIVLHLDMIGVAVITGSACFSRSLQASHILLAMGFSHERAHGSIRFSLSKFNNDKDIVYTVKNLNRIVEKLRSLSPLS